MIQGLISEPNFLLVGISHRRAVSFKSEKEHYPCSFALIHFILYFIQKLLRAAHQSAIYATTCTKEAQTLSFPLS